MFAMFAPILLTFASFAAAAPRELDQRADMEGLYLANCHTNVPLANMESWKEIDWYSNARQKSQQNESPDDLARFDAGPGIGAFDSFTRWFGNQPCVGDWQLQQNDATNACYLIDENKWTTGSIGDVIGEATNNWGTRFTCRRDSFRVLYTTLKVSCNSVAYCFVE